MGICTMDFFLLSHCDTSKAFKLLSSTYQSSVDILSYSITYDIQKSKQYLDEEIEGLDALQTVFENYIKNQLNPEYNINHEINGLKSIFPLTTEHAEEILHFKYNHHTITINNIFTDYYTEDYLLSYDPEEHMSAQQIDELFGDVDDVFDHDITSDCIPDPETDTETESETDMDTIDTETDITSDPEFDEEKKQILDFFHINSRTQTKKNKYKFEKRTDTLYLGECRETCEQLQDAVQWMQCDGCTG